jgi:PAS domain S-box-containing protein
LVLTATAWYAVDQSVRAKVQLQFDNRTSEISTAISVRMDGYEQVLQGVVGLFLSSENVPRNGFHTYVSSLNLEKNWPGIQGIGFSIPVTVGDKAKHIRDIRNEGFPKYTIKPEGDREEYSAIIYLEPFDWRNKRAFGYDMWSNDIRREAMTRARDTGKASTSGIITLVQETDTDVQKGFLTYLPLYQDGVSLETIEQRRRAFIGWVYSPFRMRDLMAGILGSDQTEVVYKIFDGDSISKETMLFDSNKSFHNENPPAADTLMKTVLLELQGRKWTLHFTIGRNAQGASESRQPIIVAIAGLVVSFLLFIIVSSLATRQKYVEELARSMGTQLRIATELAVTNKELAFQKLAIDEHAIVSISDAKGDITYVNDKFCEISGYSREELIGQNHRILKSDEHSPAFYKDLWGTIASGKTWNGNIKNQKKDGGFYWVSATIIPFMDEQRKPFKYVAIRTDITARIRAEEGLRRTQKMEAIGELTGGIAHDFNNLLGIIIGNLDLISRKMESGGKLQKQLEKAQKAALRGAALTKRLLNFSSYSAEAHSPVNVSKVVDEFEELVRKSLTVNIAVEIHCADDLWMVDLNPDDFEDALINLSLNARDAMPKGGSLIIEVNNTILDGKFTEFEEGLEPGQYVEIAVSDAGTGMSKVVADKIFDPFFTTKDKDKGTGLGLAMVYGFVQRTRGHITVYSEVGEGTTFRMYLPRSMSQAECAENSARIVGSLPEGTETVLIVDDEEELAAVAESILNGLGYTTICTHSGHEAQQVLGNNNTIDLVFSDVVMPGGMSGFDLANIIDEEYPNVKILLTSGFTGKTKQAGLAGELTQKMVMKPYRDIELATRVRETLDEVR